MSPLWYVHVSPYFFVQICACVPLLFCPNSCMCPPHSILCTISKLFRHWRLSAVRKNWTTNLPKFQYQLCICPNLWNFILMQSKYNLNFPSKGCVMIVSLSSAFTIKNKNKPRIRKKWSKKEYFLKKFRENHKKSVQQKTDETSRRILSFVKSREIAKKTMQTSTAFVFQKQNFMWNRNKEKIDKDFFRENTVDEHSGTAESLNFTWKRRWPSSFCHEIQLNRQLTRNPWKYRWRTFRNSRELYYSVKTPKIQKFFKERSGFSVKTSQSQLLRLFKIKNNLVKSFPNTHGVDNWSCLFERIKMPPKKDKYV